MLTDLLIENALEESERGFCQHILYGKEVDPVSVRDLCLTVPMSFSATPRQLIVIKEAQDISRDMDPIYRYLTSPNPSTTFLLSYKGVKTIDKKIPKNPTIYKADVLKEKDMPKWILGQFKSEGFSINSDALTTIIDYAGNNLERIKNEIDKLLISADKLKPISAEDIQQSFGIMREYTIFDFQNALGEKNYTKIFRIIDVYVKNEKNFAFEQIIAVLYSFYKSLYQLKLAQRMYKRTEEIGAAIGYSNADLWKLNNQMKYTSKYDITQIENAILSLHEMDKKRKGMSGIAMDYEELMKEMVLRLIA
jgi:DNA polymerase-3 subunit delta